MLSRQPAAFSAAGFSYSPAHGTPHQPKIPSADKGKPGFRSGNNGGLTPAQDERYKPSA